MSRALLSVTDKSGIVEFAQALVARGFEIVSTGGTAKALRDAALRVLDVAQVTGLPEMLDGRVKTLHPLIHGGLLGDTRLESHRSQMQKAGLEPIQIVCVNLYQFALTVRGDHSFEEAVESIDIGGPAMIRASAKNHANVAVVVDPDDYASIISALDENRLDHLRPALAAKAFRHTAAYDALIAQYLTAEPLPEALTIGLERVQAFRYGENPHQSGALYRDPLVTGGLANGEQLWGKELSFNNVNDANGAWELVSDLPAGSCAIIKHTTPCGVACADSLAESYRLSRESDPISAFGGIAAFNSEVDLAAAEAMTEKGNFLEVVIAPKFSEQALAVFKERSGWGQDVRLIRAVLAPPESFLQVKTIRGGAIVQMSDESGTESWRVVSERQPTEDELAALHLQWKIVPHVKSNAIVVGNRSRMLGVGAGQMNRVQSVRLALEQAGRAAHGAVLASDAFFPFPDSVLTAAVSGIAAIVQPGGSKKDQDVIDAANQHGLSMVFTGVRHFLH